MFLMKRSVRKFWLYHSKKVIATVTALFFVTALLSGSALASSHSNHWAHDYLSMAERDGGLSSGYNPDSSATRETVKSILFHAIYKQSSPDMGGLKISFTDTIEQETVILASKGIITGYPDGTFRPQTYINRAETTTLLLKSALGGEFNNLADIPNKFWDVDPKHWAARTINHANKMDIVFGYKEDGSFRPESRVSIAEAAAMIYRVVQQYDLDKSSVEPPPGNTNSNVSNGNANPGVEPPPGNTNNNNNNNNNNPRVEPPPSGNTNGNNTSSGSLEISSFTLEKYTLNTSERIVPYFNLNNTTNQRAQVKILVNGQKYDAFSGVYAPSTAGTYTVTLEATVGNMVKTKAVTITVKSAQSSTSSAKVESPPSSSNSSTKIEPAPATSNSPAIETPPTTSGSPAVEAPPTH